MLNACFENRNLLYKNQDFSNPNQCQKKLIFFKKYDSTTVPRA
jgi:hypothetical protein